MPELPEIQTTLNGISPYLQDQMISEVVIRQPKLRWPISPELAHLDNAKIYALSRRAKYLVLHTTKGCIIGHLGMSGSIRIANHGDPLKKHDHVDIIVNNGKLLRYNDPRRFGAWLWAENLDNFALFKHLGPEPLSDEFNADYLWNKSRKKNLPVKSFLMANNIVVGVGNIYASESLFLANIHPKLPTHSLAKENCETLVIIIKEVLSNAIKQGGTTLKDFLQPNGSPGYFSQKLFVYGRKDLPCLVCKTNIKALVIGQRNSFYCPDCQPLP